MDWEYIGEVNGKCYTGVQPYKREQVSLCTVQLFVKVIGGKPFFAIKHPEKAYDQNFYNVKAVEASGSARFDDKKYVFALPKFS